MVYFSASRNSEHYLERIYCEHLFVFGACFLETCEVGPYEWLDPLLSPLRVKRGRDFREGVVVG